MSGFSQTAMSITNAHNFAIHNSPLTLVQGNSNIYNVNSIDRAELGA